MNITEKEKQCLSLTVGYVVPKKPVFVKDTLNSIIEAIRGEGILMLPIVLVLGVLLAPIFLYEAYKLHKQKKAEYGELLNKFNSFNGYQGEKHIESLWSEYGLYPLKFLGKEKEIILADCLSKWITILHDKQYHIEGNEIIQMFKVQAKKQGQLYNEALKSGIRLQLTDWRVVVVNELLNSLPKYA